MPELHLIIKGRVQGVFFRAKSKKNADYLDLKGWVRNLPDGSVECLIQGDDQKIQKFLQWCEHGPDLAKITDIEVNWQEVSKKYNDFSILR